MGGERRVRHGGRGGRRVRWTECIASVRSILYIVISLAQKQTLRVGGGAAGRSRSASAQRAPADCSNASPSLRVRDEPSQFARSSFIPGDGQPAARDALPTSGVLRAAEGHAARRGGLGARRWADIRQAARLACDTGVMVKLHDVEIHPLLTEDGQAFLSYDKENGGQCNRHDAGRGQKPSNTIGKASARELQRQQRSARRLLKFQEVKRFWLTAAQQLLHGDRAKLRNDVWTSWMRSRPTPPAPPVPVPAAAAVIAPAPGMRQSTASSAPCGRARSPLQQNDLGLAYSSYQSRVR